MKHVKKVIIAIVLVINNNHCHAQNVETTPTILTPLAFAAIVKKYHPIIKQADVNIEAAMANITVAKAGFDPTIYIQNNQKTFTDVAYYNYTNAELKIPTWYGIEVKTGIENNSGTFLNTELTSGQTSYIGITVPLAKNLLMDKRRAVLLQAKIFVNQSNADKQNTVNDVVFDAFCTYWNWVKEYEVYQVITNTLAINKARYSLIKIAYRQGDRPAIDTIEAYAQLQNFEFLQNESLIKFYNAGVALSAYLWQADNTYYLLQNNTRPDGNWLNNLTMQPIMEVENVIASAKLTHPKLRIYNYKLQMLEVEKKLKFQNLLPTINVKANLLQKGNNALKNVAWNYVENNNKFGIDIGLPLRFSEGRGNYKLAKLKIQETTYQQNLQVQQIENKIRYYHNETIGLQQQIAMYEAIYKNYQLLLRGEETKFSAGESSLFMLNSRENKVLEALQKLVELKTKFLKAQLGIQWAAGLLQ